MSDILVKAALFLPAFFALAALCACFQRRRAQRRGSWQYLTPGPWFWLGLVCGVLVTGVAALVVAGGRVERGSGLLFTSLFALVTGLLALNAIFEEVRWNRHRIERRTLLGQRVGFGWHELARFDVEWTGYAWIASFEGPRLRFAPHDNGVEQLMRMIVRHLPRDLPPADPVIDAEPAFAEIALGGARRS